MVSPHLLPPGNLCIGEDSRKPGSHAGLRSCGGRLGDEERPTNGRALRIIRSDDVGWDAVAVDAEAGQGRMNDTVRELKLSHTSRLEEFRQGLVGGGGDREGTSGITHGYERCGIVREEWRVACGLCCRSGVLWDPFYITYALWRGVLSMVTSKRHRVRQSCQSKGCVYRSWV